ncbi:hypothetical protein J3D54_005166 [Pseudomonas sp. GGS8]|uniref:hypothetical protein n=1 Tax=Pseudomonas sp. GGS8 TaxID=2817892 RepID=UPI00209FBAAB|nr:hypothetical protein [Pseudomonas sp. GGS8]MCP1446034.1 hypothetical protein [Pseudomonas sp. GGS8]
MKGQPRKDGREPTQAYQFQPSMFAMLLLDTFDQASNIAHLKNIQLLHDLDEDAEPCLGLAVVRDRRSGPRLPS